MPSKQPVSTDAAEFAGQLFFRLWRASHTRVAEALNTIGLTPALFLLLNFLGGRDGAIQQEIGTALGVDPSTMVSLIDALEEEGLANRRPHSKDRRAREVTLTPKGRRRLDQAREVAQGVEDEVLRGLSAPERRKLLSLLRQALDSAPPQSSWSAEEGD